MEPSRKKEPFPPLRSQATTSKVYAQGHVVGETVRSLGPKSRGLAQSVGRFSRVLGLAVRPI